MIWFWLSRIDCAVPKYLHLVFPAIVVGIQFRLFIYPLFPYGVPPWQWHIENIMNSSFLRKLWLVFLLSDKMKHLERPKELCLQLLVALALDIFAVQSNFLIGKIALGFDSFILSPFLKFLGKVEVFLANSYQLSEFCWYFVYRLGLGVGVNILLVWHPRVVATIQLEKRMTGASILGVIVSELSHW